jgi:photosystem II stability/assembly factor-like uncharacterized protein
MRPHIFLVTALAVFAGCRSSAPDYPLPREAGYARWKHYYEERAYPFGSIPANGRRAALAEALQRATVESEGAGSEAVLSSGNLWRSLGPTPVETAFSWRWASGRINALAISPADPNLILAGSSSGGVWRSTNGGATFAPVSDSHVDLSIGAIAFAPSNPSIVYAAMGSDFLGTGVLRSDDAGASWRDVSGPTFAQRGRSLRAGVDATNPNRLWIAQVERERTDPSQFIGVFVSEDGGVTWQNVLAAPVTDFLVVPGTSETLLASVGAIAGSLRPGVYKSVDGGKNWTLILPAGSFFPIQGEFVLGVPANLPNRYYAYGGQDTLRHEHNLFVSNDSGATWTRITPDIPTEFAWYLGIDAVDPNTIYLGFRDAYRSRDGGVTWTNVTKSLTENGDFVPHLSTTHIDQHSFASVPVATYLGNDGGIFRSNDGGTTYTSMSPTLSVVQAYGVSTHPTDPAIVYLGTQDNGLERRGANGAWRELVTGDYGSIVFDPNNPSRVITNYIEGQMFLVDERDRFFLAASHETWGEPIQRARIAFIAPFEQSRSRGTLYFGTYRLFVSDNFGGTWRTTSDTDLTFGDRDRLRAIGLTETDASVIYTGSQNGRVMVSRNGGISWTDITAGLPQRTVKSFVLDPRDPAKAYVSFSGYGSAHVFLTHNYGASWTAAAAGLPDVPANALILDPRNPDVVYAGTDIGVFRRTGDHAWTFFNHGLPNVLVNDFAVTADNRVIAATYGRGAYELTGGTGTRKRRSVR